MKFYIGVTDNTWFKFLAEREPDEVNFWQPSGTAAFRALRPGELFLFKLHAPLNFIAGGGFFVKHSIVPLSLAWEAFAEKNGAEDLNTFRDKVIRYKGRNSRFEPDPTIGCIILSQPFFLDRSEWVPAPEDWHPNIVQGKTYGTDDRIGAALWSDIQERLSHQVKLDDYQVVAEENARYGNEQVIRPRLGQGAFRVLVTDAYQRRCAMTGERTLPVLESAHIKPYARSGPHSINNGLLLRSDLHKLFDLGYITVTGDMLIKVSKRIKEEFKNGRNYYALDGQSLISLPSEPVYRPARDYLDWHNEKIFLP
ncbi:MAG: HNH endonuclease [Dissulfurispiraceae bacterium]|jgi:putative restriction endonuclease